jgi:cell division protein FtsA
MAGARVKSARVAVNGRHVQCRRIGADLDLEDGRVALEDVEECQRAGAEAARVEGRATLFAAPARFLLDGEDVAWAPVGLAGARLSAEIVAVSARECAIANIEGLVERCGLRAERCTPAPLAAAEAALTEDEKDLGAVILDIGAASAGFAVFERGALVDCGGVPVGGDHVTRDISQIFGTPLAQAERIKTLYGSALVGAGDEHRLVDMPQLGGQETARVSRAEVSAVITPRLEEIFELAMQRLPGDARARLGVRRLAMTGGGSLLVGARETAERVLGLKARLARPSPAAGSPDAATTPQFAVCAGLIELAARERASRRRAFFQTARPRVAGRGLAASVGGWLRDNF